MDWQLIAVTVILILCVLWLVRGAVRRRRVKAGSDCIGCPLADQCGSAGRRRKPYTTCSCGSRGNSCCR